MDTGPYLAQISLTNADRLVILALGAIPVNLLHIIFFILNHSSRADSTEKTWSIGIILSHSFLMVFFIMLSAVIPNIRKKEHSTGIQLIQFSIVPVFLVFGILITGIDQLVTTSITPFLVACTITAVMFLTPPLYTLATYTVSILLFFFMLRYTQTDMSILLSSRVNGITFTGIGILLSLLLWKKHTLTLAQQEQIHVQNEELKKKNQQLELFAFYDPLTMLYNRRKFHSLMKKKLSSCGESEYLSITLLDLDHFKSVNDKYGHSAGDTVLSQLGAMLAKEIRERDFSARWGGEEFIIAMPGTSLDEAVARSEQIRNRIERMTFISETGDTIRVTASFGTASVQCRNAASFLSLYQKADKALYQAKHLGRNRVEAAFD